MKKFKQESGEVMLEGMIVMVISMLMLVWILAVGFLYYQKYTVKITTNDVAEKIALTYDTPSSDIIMGYMSSQDFSRRKLYFKEGGLAETNKLRVESYVNYIMEKANLFGTVKSVDVKLDCKPDGLGRSHVVVTTECTFETPFGAALKLFGMDPVRKYTVVAYADSTSLTDYISTVTMVDAFTDGTFLKGTRFIESTVKMIDTFMDLCE